jgi:hypothetical protein
MLRKPAIIGIVAVLFGINGAVAQNAPLTDCDTLASNPNDPQRKAPGVLPDKINPTLAVPACEKAVAQYPDDMRLNFQLGRAYEIAKKIPLALRQYQKTADQGYAPG